MINVLLDPLPTEWNGYQINTWFQIGIQISLILYDNSMNTYEKNAILTELLFDDRDHPQGEELDECIEWFVSGWFHDNPGSSKDKRRLVDYDIDQWRIYADFQQIYGIDLSTADMHWWTFCGLLWNMPYKYSSFLHVIEIRQKKITAKMDKEEKKTIREAQRIYSLEQPEKKKEYTPEETQAIDDFDRMMAQIRSKKTN